MILNARYINLTALLTKNINKEIGKTNGKKKYIKKFKVTGLECSIEGGEIIINRSFVFILKNIFLFL